MNEMYFVLKMLWHSCNFGFLALSSFLHMYHSSLFWIIQSIYSYLSTRYRTRVTISHDGGGSNGSL